MSHRRVFCREICQTYSESCPPLTQLQHLIPSVWKQAINPSMYEYYKFRLIFFCSTMERWAGFACQLPHTFKCMQFDCRCLSERALSPPFPRAIGAPLSAKAIWQLPRVLNVVSGGSSGSAHLLTNIAGLSTYRNLLDLHRCRLLHATFY